MRKAKSFWRRLIPRLTWFTGTSTLPRSSSSSPEESLVKGSLLFLCVCSTYNQVSYFLSATTTTEASLCSKPGLGRNTLQRRVEENPLWAQHSPEINHLPSGWKKGKEKNNCSISTRTLIHKHTLEIIDETGGEKERNCNSFSWQLSPGWRC